MSLTHLLGTDCSFYQDDNNTPQKIDFVKMREAGASFTILRAGQRTWNDPDFADYWRAAKAADLPRGSYWYYDNDAPPKIQVDLWVKAIGADYPECGLWADFEDRTGAMYAGEKNYKEFMELLKDRFPTMVEIGVYTAHYFWMERIKDFAYWHQYPLWIANYSVDKPRVPKPWTENKWTFWQFTDKGDGLKYGAESLNIDLNYFNGGKPEFYKQFEVASEPVPPPTKRIRIDLDGDVWVGDVRKEE